MSAVTTARTPSQLRELEALLLSSPFVPDAYVRGTATDDELAALSVQAAGARVTLEARQVQDDGLYTHILQCLRDMERATTHRELDYCYASLTAATRGLSFDEQIAPCAISMYVLAKVKRSLRMKTCLE